ncbi:MAG: hypothetical protein Q3988_04070 [Gemella sp.]|nr:hypothetical protein [Gemella sp.]
MTERNFIIKNGALLLGMIILPLTQLDIVMSNKLGPIIMILSVGAMAYGIIGGYRHLKKIGYFYEKKELKYIVGDEEGLKNYKKDKITRNLMTIGVIFVMSFLFKTHYPLVIFFIVLFLVSCVFDYIEYADIRDSLRS